MSNRIPSLLKPKGQIGHGHRIFRMQTLLRLRWLTLLGQGATVIFVHFGLGLPLPLESIALVLALALALNIGLRSQFESSYRVEEAAAFVLLIADIIQLAALLALTGGVQNPFSILFLAPVLISATALPARRTVALGLLAIFASSFVTLFHMPMAWFGGVSLILPNEYIFAIWVALQVGIIFIGVYAWRVSQESRQLLEALVATEFILAREKHLSQVDGLAAAAAHQLGTPLATIALVVKEILNASKAEDTHYHDLLLLKEQTDRCREILSRIASLSTESGGVLGYLAISALIEEAMEPYHGIREEGITVSLNGALPEPKCRRNPGLAYGLGNLIQNALSYARSRVEVEAYWDDATVRILIRDDGPGFPPQALGHIGEPYLSIRPHGLQQVQDDHPEGLGLGLFIAKTLLERAGATLEATNQPAPLTGALLKVTWPRHLFEDKMRIDVEGEEDADLALPVSPLAARHAGSF